jgi:hypothetical protein
MRTAFLALALAACDSSKSPPAAVPPDATRAPDAVGVMPDAASGGATVDAAPDAFVDRGVEQDYDDLAQTLAATVRVPQLIAMQDGINLAYSDMLPGFTTVQPGEIQGTRDGVSYDYVFHCEDQMAQDNFTCGPASNHIHEYATIIGPFMIDQLSISELTFTTRWTTREIYLNKPQVEGTARFVMTAALSTTGTQFQLTIDGTNYDHVRLDPMPTLPFAGDITYAITAQRSRATATPSSRDFTSAATITFAAGGQATIVLDGTHTYSIDMSSGAVMRQ